MNWDEWQSQSFTTFYKDDCGTGNFEDWTYYILRSGSATMTGYGRLDGSQFSLTHAPVNKLFAYQVGVGASNVNGNFGNGGWFMAAGELVVDGERFSNLMVTGDFAFDADCCPTYELERTWSATDCSGNTSELGTQTISFARLDSIDGGLVAPPAKDLDLNPAAGILQDNGFENTVTFATSIVPNPASDEASFSYILNKPTNLQIDIIDTNGNVIQKVFSGTASADFKHVHQIQTGFMSSGVYLIRVAAEKEMNFTRLVVVH